MARRGVVAGVLGLLTFASLAPASAQGIFERIFGGLRHAVEAPPQPPTNIQAFVDPFASHRAIAITPSQQRARSRPGQGVLRAHLRRPFLSGAGACRLERRRGVPLVLPGEPDPVYSGGSIDHAVASDGSRYADLDNAFVYRKQLVAGCTCNGRDAFGLAPRGRATAIRRCGQATSWRPRAVWWPFTGHEETTSPISRRSTRYRGLSQEHARQAVRHQNHAAQSGRAGADHGRGSSAVARGDSSRALSFRDSRPPPPPATASTSAPATRSRTSAPVPAGRAAPARRSGNPPAGSPGP